jgi:hypothetical protein
MRARELMPSQRDIGTDQRGRYDLQMNGKQIGQRIDGLFDGWSGAPEEEDVPNLVIKESRDDDLRSSLHMFDEQRLRGRHVVFGCVRNEPLEGDGGVDHQIDQRRPRSRASSASAVEIGLRCSALRSNLENALRPAGSSMGRRTRRASARAARRRNELRVSPALRAAASMTRRSVSGNETRTLRMTTGYPSDFRGGRSRPTRIKPIQDGSVGGVGGAERDRTVDLLNAIQALSQLSYGPTLPGTAGRYGN